MNLVLVLGPLKIEVVMTMIIVMVLVDGECNVTNFEGCSMYRCAFIYNYYMYRWYGGIHESMYTIGYCMCNRLLAIYVSTAVHLYVWILQSYTSILYCCSCLILPLQPPSYNILRCGFCIVIWHLSDDGLSLGALECQ